jgi:hypothetical protein
MQMRNPANVQGQKSEVGECGGGLRYIPRYLVLIAKHRKADNSPLSLPPEMFNNSDTRNAAFRTFEELLVIGRSKPTRQDKSCRVSE